ncbi:hypothetical protein [Azospirillum largimobile]
MPLGMGHPSPRQAVSSRSRFPCRGARWGRPTVAGRDPSCWVPPKRNLRSPRIFQGVCLCERNSPHGQGAQ